MNLEQTVTQSNLTLKIAKIMAELPEIEKQNVKFETRNGKNVFYKAYGIDQITGLLRQRIGESKISITPAITGVVEIKNNTWVQMEYTMIDGESGDTMVKPWLQPMSSGGSIDKDMGATLSYATKNFLMRTFMISPEGDPDIDTNPPPSDDGKQHQPGNGNKPAPTREPIVPPNKSKELHNTVQALRSLKVVGKHKQASYEGKLDYDDVPGGVPVILFNEHLAEIDRLIGKDEGFSKSILDAHNKIDFTQELAIRVIWYAKGNTLKMAPEGEHPIGFDNPQVLYQFQKESDGIDESILLEALGVDSLHDYKDGIYTARDALQRHLNPASNGTGKTIDMEDLYRKSQLGSSVYLKAKQTPLDHMPAVDGDMVTTKEQ